MESVTSAGVAHSAHGQESGGRGVSGQETRRRTRPGWLVEEEEREKSDEEEDEGCSKPRGRLRVAAGVMARCLAMASLLQLLGDVQAWAARIRQPVDRASQFRCPSIVSRWRTYSVPPTLQLERRDDRMANTGRKL